MSSGADGFSFMPTSSPLPIAVSSEGSEYGAQLGAARSPAAPQHRMSSH
jgi:hypothetical protein